MNTKPHFATTTRLATALWLMALSTTPAQTAVQAWVQRYNGPGNGYDQGTAMAVDNTGNVFVTGSSFGSNYDFVTIKYSNAGAPLWTNRYNGPRNGDDFANAIAVDNSGNVFVTGTSFDASRTSASSGDYVTLGYSNAGAPLWTNRYHGSASGEDLAQAIAVDSSGNVFVT